jgi:ribose 5-phosphate isomerase B
MSWPLTAKVQHHWVRSDGRGRRGYMLSGSKHAIVLGSDHAGYGLKQMIARQLQAIDTSFQDVGSPDAAPCDYPDYANALAYELRHKPQSIGILICGSGIGMSIAANRYSHVRAALCTTPEMAALARRHNDANVLVLGARLITADAAWDCVQTFLHMPFEQGRHALRLTKLLCRAGAIGG